MRLDALLEIGCRFASPRTSSGLVEQQRLFAKAKHLFGTIAMRKEIEGR